MAVISTSFRWLDFLEKEFDQAFVDLDVLLGDFDSDDPGMVYTVRQKLATLSSCFAQLSHKAQTIFQMNAKSEAELINLREEIVEAKSQNDNLNRELHLLLVQLHTSQLGKLDEDNSAVIKQRLEDDLAHRSPTHRALITGGNVDNIVIALENWKRHLLAENAALRNCIVTLQAELCGSRLAARYLDKELAGRIQQLQLLGRSDMNTECRDKLWRQLEAEILLQRHKTVQRAVRQQTVNTAQPPTSITNVVRTVMLKREAFTELGISITGGKEHGVPILISELEPKIAQGLYVGDAIISVNGTSLAQMTHQQAVDLLNKQVGTIKLCVQYLSSSDCDDDYNEPSNDSELKRFRYGYFSEEDEEKIEAYVRRITSTTPTAPRTPETDRSVSENNAADESVIEQSINREDSSNSSKNSHSTDYYGVTTLQKIFQSLSPRVQIGEATNKSTKPSETVQSPKESSISSVVSSDKPRNQSSESKDPLKLETTKVEIDLSSNNTSVKSENWIQNSSDSPILTSSSMDCISSDSDNSIDKRLAAKQIFSKSFRAKHNSFVDERSKVRHEGHNYFPKVNAKNCAKQEMSRKHCSRSLSSDEMNVKKTSTQMAAPSETVHVYKSGSNNHRQLDQSQSVPEVPRQNIPVKLVAANGSTRSDCCSSKRTSVEILSPDDNSNLYRLVENRDSVCSGKSDKVVRHTSIDSDMAPRSRKSSDKSSRDDLMNQLKAASVSKEVTDSRYLYNNLDDANIGTPV
ncbi:unnamed protein product [Bemisia tabaci]|uniref:PDZ domain-containing protein n=1 Tax=Bemisia tabaci TaxID=7038 RepID=A0A9P0F6B0_BEMTA|nr:unnamed protein product [Bemisia tabaci]